MGPFSWRSSSEVEWCRHGLLKLPCVDTCMSRLWKFYWKTFFSYPVGVIGFYVSYFFLPPGAILSDLTGSWEIRFSCETFVRLMSDLCQFRVGPSSCLKLAGSKMLNHFLEGGDISKLESRMIWCWESKLPLREPVGNHPFTPKMFAPSSGGTATATECVDLCGCKPLHRWLGPKVCHCGTLHSTWEN